MTTPLFIMKTFFAIYLIIGVVFSIAIWTQRNRRDITRPYTSAIAILLIWPIILGVHCGEVVKHGYYIRKKKDRQSK